MKVGILGTGDVGKALARGFVGLGHDVKIGSRDASKSSAIAKEVSGKASGGTFKDAASFGEIVVIATLGTAAVESIEQAGADNFSGKLVIDTTNPLEHKNGKPQLAVGWTDSGGERVQRAIPKAHVVKCWNTVGNALMYKPSLPGGPPTMFIAGNDADSKARMSKLLTDFGWEAADLGGIESSRYLEPMCLAWVTYGMVNKQWGHAYKLLKK